MSRLPFKSVFCERFKCSPDDYEEQAFRKLLYWHARFLAPVIRIIKRDFFLEDFKFIRYLGESLDVRQAKVDVLDFKDFDRKHWGLLHTGKRAASRSSFLGRPTGPSGRPCSAWSNQINSSTHSSREHVRVSRPF